jgi:hypothetical protein
MVALMKDSSTPDMYNKIESESTGLGRLASEIPGFDGYIERSRRREADQRLRIAMADRLEESRLHLANIHQDLGRDVVKAIDYSEDLGRADTRLMGLIGKIRDAPEGYAGFFDANKIKEDDLTRIYDFDESMLAFCDQINADIDALEKAVIEDGDIQSCIRTIDITLREANTAFQGRKEILSGIA